MILKNANFYDKLTACFGDLAKFEQNIYQLAQIAGLNLAEFEIDHLAVRVNSVEKAEQWRAFLLENATLLKESEVNGRPIGLFEFPKPLIFAHQAVSVIELPFPKGKIYPCEGWEHIEIVFPMTENEQVEQWVARTLTSFQLAHNPNLKIKVSQVKVDGERLPNPSIAISLLGTNASSFCLKLHPYSIKTIIHSENTL